MPGCAAPGVACDVHHAVGWADGGPTDLDNLLLACPRHHTEVHQGTWEIHVHEGIPWVRVPSWVDRRRPLLRNLVHTGTEHLPGPGDDGCAAGPPGGGVSP